MDNTFVIRFVDGIIQASKESDILTIENWLIESKKDKISCIFKDNNTFTKYQVFSNGFYKLCKTKVVSKKWITIKKGFMKKPNKKEEFTGFIILPYNGDFKKIHCELTENVYASN